MIDTKALRSRVLDFAIQGKLTEQLESDGTAEELYQQIQTEKQRLIQEGKIKKEKPMPEIKPEEVPFEIPRNWKWVRLSSISKKITDGTHHSPVNTESGDFMYVTAKNIKENGVDLSNITYVSKDVHEEIIARCNPELNDILLIKDGATTGVVTVNNISEPFSLLSSVALIKPVVCMIDPWYIVYVLRSSLFYKSIRAQMTGTGITRIVLRQIEPFLVPLPPLAEQKRIVTRVEEIFRLLDIIDEAQKQYAMDVESLKAKLVTAGIQGKLTEQLESDGTAEELYQQIQEEKQRLIKEGKIKKEKPLPEIKPEEIPFEIPGSWKWVRIIDIFNVGTGLTPSKKEKKYYNNGNIPWVNSSLTANRYINRVNTFVSEKAIDELNLKLYPEHTLIIAMYGEGKTRGQISELLIPATTNQACATLSSVIYNQETVDYTYYFFNNYYETLRALAYGGNQPNLNLQKIKDVLIPLPPVAEQKRIVEKLDAVLEALNIT